MPPKTTQPEELHIGGLPKIRKPKGFHDERKTFIGASEIAAVCGVHPYATPFTVWCEKRGLTEPKDQTEPMYWGNRLESEVAKEFTRRTKIKLVKGKTCRHEKFPYFAATPDFELVGMNGLLECKIAGHFSGKNFGENGSDEVPQQYVMQCMWQIYICQKEFCYLAVLIENREYRIFRITRDDELIDSMKRIAYKFWNENVLTGDPPPFTGHEPDVEALKRLYTFDNGGRTNTDEEHDEIAIDLGKVLQQKAEIDIECERLKNILKGFMGEASILESSAGDFTWITNAKGVRTFRTPFKTGRA